MWIAKRDRTMTIRDQMLNAKIEAAMRALQHRHNHQWLQRLMNWIDSLEPYGVYHV